MQGETSKERVLSDVLHKEFDESNIPRGENMVDKAKAISAFPLFMPKLFIGGNQDMKDNLLPINEKLPVSNGDDNEESNTRMSAPSNEAVAQTVTSSGA